MMIGQVIADYNDYIPTFGGGLTNHLNMALYALYQLGGEESLLRTFASRYLGERDIKVCGPPRHEIDSHTFDGSLGKSDTYMDFVVYYRREVSKMGLDEVLSSYLNHLIRGSVGGAFHGLIRMAYALELGDEDEIIKALAYWSSAYVFLPPPVSMDLSQEPTKVFSNMREHIDFDGLEFKRPLITGRICDAYDFESLYKGLLGLKEDMREFKHLVVIALDAYASSHDFTLLHGLTSTHALYRIASYLKDPKKAINHHYINLQLAYGSTGACDLKPYRLRTDLHTWDQIKKETLKSKDPHTIKLVYTLYSLRSFGRDDLLRSLAMDKLQA